MSYNYFNCPYIFEELQLYIHPFIFFLLNFTCQLFSYIFFLLFLDGLNEIKGLRVDISSVETNIIYVEIEEGSRTTAAKLCKDLEDYGILLMPMDSSRLRIVFHHQLSATDVHYALSCFQQAVNGVRNENGN
ncbi:hypothetical protein AAZX31_19G233700 [Glycine max]